MMGLSAIFLKTVTVSGVCAVCVEVHNTAEGQSVGRFWKGTSCLSSTTSSRFIYCHNTEYSEFRAVLHFNR